MGLKRTVGAPAALALLAAWGAAGCGSEPTGPVELAPSWEALPSLPVPVRSPAVATDGQRIYVAGGYGVQGRINVFQILDLESESWSFGPPLPEATDWATSVWVGGRLHLVGGVTDGSGIVDQHLTYAPGASEWLPAPAVPRHVAGTASVAHESRIYVFAGNSGGSPAHTSATSIFDSSSQTWSTGLDVPGARINWAGAVAEDRVYLIGGGTSGLATSSDLLIYSPATDSWDSGPTIPLPREAHGVGAVRDLVCAVGGRLAASGNFSPPFDSVLCFDVTRGEWTPGPSLPVALQEVNVVSLPNAFVAIGGAGEDTQPVGHVWILRAE